MNVPRLKSMLESVAGLGPYLLMELLLPGGTLLAMVLWLCRRWRGASY
jgi:hypothetical protein